MSCWIDSLVRHETPKKGRRMHQPKSCEYNNKDEDNSLNKLKDENYQASYQKSRPLGY